MDRLISAYCRALTSLNVVVLAVMVVLVFGNVVLRYGFNSGIVVSEEMSRWLFVWMTFMGAVVALHERAHLGTDLLVSRLPRASRMLCLFVSQLMMIYVSWLVLSGSLVQAQLNLDVAAPVTGVPVMVFYGAGVLFGVSALVILAYGLWRLLLGRTSDADLVMVSESEERPHSPGHLDHDAYGRRP